jgi:signal transduction histidine kinase
MPCGASIWHGDAMSVPTPSAARLEDAQRAASPAQAPPPYRLLVPLGLGVVVIVVLEAALGPVGFGAGGRPLLLAAAAVVYAGTGYAFLSGLAPRPAASMALLAGMAASTLAMHAIDPSGPVIGLFLVAAFTPLRPPLRVASAILVASTVAYNVLQLLLAGETVLLTVATDAGVAFFFLVGTLLRRERQQREELVLLMAALEESRAAEQTAVAEAERARLARDIHDVLASTLSGLALQLEGATLLASTIPTDPRLVDAVRRAHRLSRSGLAEARRAVGALRGERPPGVADIPVLVEEHRLASAGPVTFSVEGDPVELAAEAGAALYRAVQEALSNVRKHAGNAAVDLHLAWRGDGVELTVTDTGGPARTPQGGSGYGLCGMSERVRGIGGTVTTGDAPGGGFRVHVAVPSGIRSATA